MTKSYWRTGVNEIIAHVLNGKRTIKEAVRYMDTNFVDPCSTTAFKHMAWEATSSDQTNEMTVYNMLKDAVKLGGANDFNFERVLR